MFTLTKNNFACASRYLYISLPSLYYYDMKRPNFASPRYGVGERSKKIFPFFLQT